MKRKRLKKVGVRDQVGEKGLGVQLRDLVERRGNHLSSTSHLL